jgi:hypothetical protein
MPQTFIFRPDGSFYYKNITDTKELEILNLQYAKHYSCAGFYFDRSNFIFYGSIDDKEPKSEVFNSIGYRAFELV